MTASRYPTIRRLHRLVDALAPEVSDSRARQLRMTVRQLERALAHDRMPHGSKSKLDALLSPRGVDAFLEAATTGELRTGPGAGELSWSSLATLRDCLRILGEAAGMDLVLPQIYRESRDLAATATPGQQAALWRRLADMAARGPLEYGHASIPVRDRTRLLAMVGVVLDTGARSTELSAMGLGDLADEMTELRVHRRPQNAAHLPAVEDVCVLREGTRVALRRWMATRAELLREGGRPAERALWVSLVPAGNQPTPGWRLGPRGVRDAYTRGVRLLNGVMAGEPGWEPLPRHLEQLRRAVVPVAAVASHAR